MEVFCGAVEHTDYQVGRIVDAVEEMGELDNTLIVWIAGDNGPTPEGGLHGIVNKLTYFNGVVESLEDVASQLDEFGGPKTHGCYPASWAYATSTPFNYGKMVTSGGGCSTAVLMSWPARISDHGGMRRQFHHLIDVAPTILECIGLPEPTRVDGIDQMPMQGVSMRYTFDDPQAAERHTTQYFSEPRRAAAASITPVGGPAPDTAWTGSPTQGRSSRRSTRTSGSCTTCATTSGSHTTWPPHTRTSSRNSRNCSTARLMLTTFTRWPTTPTSC